MKRCGMRWSWCDVTAAPRPVNVSPSSLSFAEWYRKLGFDYDKEVYNGDIGYIVDGVTFRWKDYRAEGRDRQKVMTLATAEFIRRFLIHVLPSGFHRIRHYGLLASGTSADNIAQARRLLDVPALQLEAGDTNDAEANEPKPLSQPCPCCGGRMIIIETFQRGSSAALPAGDFHRRDQDRHIMIKVGARQNCKTARLLRRLSTGNDHARHHTCNGLQEARTSLKIIELTSFRRIAPRPRRRRRRRCRPARPSLWR
jgi:Putative transposase